MGVVTPLPQNADRTLSHFFAVQSDFLTGSRLRRVIQAEVDLRSCFEQQAVAYLPEERVRRCAHERARGRTDPVARAAEPVVILRVLPPFLDEPRWHGVDLQDRRLRARLAWRLAQEIAHTHELRGSTVFEEVRSAVWRSRKALRQVRAELSMQRLEAAGVDMEGFKSAVRDLELRRAQAEGPADPAR